MTAVLQSRQGTTACQRVRDQSGPFLGLYVTYIGPATNRAEKCQPEPNQDPLTVYVWFYQFLLHKCLIDPFEYAKIIKEKNWGIGVLFGANSPHANSSCLL